MSLSVLAEDPALQTAVLIHEVICGMGAQDSVDGKQEFPAQSDAPCDGFVLVFMGAPWYERS